MERKYYTTSQAAHLLEVSPDTVLKWVRHGKISSYKTPGGHARIPRDAIEKLLPSQAEPAQSDKEEIPYYYCWEFHANDGSVNSNCEDCVVYRSRARRCYEMRDIPEEFGHLKLHCTTDCGQCDYYHRVQGQGTSVLIVSRNTRFKKKIERESSHGDVSVRFASGEYECSALLNRYRPDYVVLDCALGTARVQEMCRHLDNDDRIPFAKIILTSKNESVKSCFDGRIFGWIKKPFSFRTLRCCLGQAE